MAVVIAVSSFDHGGSRRRGDEFEVSDVQAAALMRAGLVIVRECEQDPGKAGGEKSSASPAAPALPQTTARKSFGGGKRKATGE